MINNSDFEKAFDLRLVLMAVGLIILSFCLAVAAAALKEKDPPRRASLAQSIFRNNCLVFGLPMMTTMYGAAEVSMFSLILAFVIPLNNVLAVLLISILTSRKITIAELLRRLITNPYVVFAIVSLVVKLTGLILPQPVMKVVTDLSSNYSCEKTFKELKNLNQAFKACNNIKQIFNVLQKYFIELYKKTKPRIDIINDKVIFYFMCDTYSGKFEDTTIILEKKKTYDEETYLTLEGKYVQLLEQFKEIQKIVWSESKNGKKAASPAIACW